MGILFDAKMTGAQLTYNDGATSETWGHDVVLASTGTDAYTFAESFIRWANAGDRAWASNRSFSYVLTKSASNYILTFTVTGGAGALLANDTLVSTMKLPSGTTVINDGGTFASTEGIPTSLSFDLSFRNYRQTKGETGCAAKTGSWQHDPMHARKKTASMLAIVDHAQLYALTVATSQAATPRRANVYDTIAQSYRRLYIAEIKTTIGKRQTHRATFTSIEV